jgi:hypothetical protein
MGYHDFTTAKKVLWVEKSNELLQFIKSVGHSRPVGFVTLDQCWFYYRRNFERQ